ncbi:hypothetical protein DYB23_17565, partial [Vibrio cholerae]|nr:hypothetical protein [Vibrio cholerae]
MQLPFSYFWMNNDALSGFSEGEHWAVLWLGALLLITGTLIINATMKTLNIHSSNIRIISLALITFGTGLFHYSTFDASFSHIYSFFGCSMLIYLAVKNSKLHGKWSINNVIFFAVITYWMYLVRQTNGAITLAVAAYAIYGAMHSERIKLAATWIISTGLALSTQLLYNYYVMGTFRVSSYGNESFPGIGTHFFDVLFSYERGLFTYYPIFLVVLIMGLISRNTLHTLVLFLLTLVFSLVYGSWHSWYLGGGMGHRGFVELTPFAII